MEDFEVALSKINLLKDKLNLLKPKEENSHLFYPNQNIHTGEYLPQRDTSRKPLSAEYLNAFENRYQIELPLVYKLFQNKIGSETLGLFPLKQEAIEEHYPNNHFENLEKRFLNRSEWNVENMETFVLRYRESKGFIRDFVDIDAFRYKYRRSQEGALEKQLTLFDIDVMFEGQDFIESLYWEYYKSSNHINGCLPIYDYGHGTYAILVLTGEEAGNVWIDNRGEFGGIYPDWNISGEKADFYTWADELIDGELERQENE